VLLFIGRGWNHHFTSGIKRINLIYCIPESCKQLREDLDPLDWGSKAITNYIDWSYWDWKRNRSEASWPVIIWMHRDKLRRGEDKSAYYLFKPHYIYIFEASPLFQFYYYFIMQY